MFVKINRTGKLICLEKAENDRHVDAITERHGYDVVSVLDVENRDDIKWEGIEFNRLFSKNGILYRFNEWIGEYPFEGIEMEEIGEID